MTPTEKKNREQVPLLELVGRKEPKYRRRTGQAVRSPRRHAILSRSVKKSIDILKPERWVKSHDNTNNRRRKNLRLDDSTDRKAKGLGALKAEQKAAEESTVNKEYFIVVS